jgi:hypothetical protein
MSRESTASCPSLQLTEPSAYCCRGAPPVQRVGEHGEDLLVTPEVGEVREREVDSPADGSVPAEVLQLGALAVST